MGFSKLPFKLLTTVLVCVATACLEASTVAAIHGDVHAFFYPWYGNPHVDGKYIHWNHRILPHWRQEVTDRYPKGQYEPPGDIGATYYPLRGFYSSSDSLVLNQQMNELKQAGVDVVVVSWWGRPSLNTSVDGEGVSTDHTLPLILHAAQRNAVRVAFHMEPYHGRTAASFREDLEYIHQNYAAHPAYYRHLATPSSTSSVQQQLPLFYIYDAYHTPAEDWATLFSPHSPTTIRETNLDAIFIGLYLNGGDSAFLESGYFDGAYTYFAATGFTYASTPHNWPALLSDYCFGAAPLPPSSASSSSSSSPSSLSSSSLLSPSVVGRYRYCSLSVGPGYEDTRIRPWNVANERGREEGRYYDRMFGEAVSAFQHVWQQPSRDHDFDELQQQQRQLQLSTHFFISLTSYNEWGEGTQLEPALPFTTNNGDKLRHYPSPYYYMERTKHWVQQFRRIKQEDDDHDQDTPSLKTDL